MRDRFALHTIVSCLRATPSRVSVNRVLAEWASHTPVLGYPNANDAVITLLEDCSRCSQDFLPHEFPISHKRQRIVAVSELNEALAGRLREAVRLWLRNFGAEWLQRLDRSTSTIWPSKHDTNGAYLFDFGYRDLLIPWALAPDIAALNELEFVLIGGPEVLEAANAFPCDDTVATLLRLADHKALRAHSRNQDGLQYKTKFRKVRVPALNTGNPHLGAVYTHLNRSPSLTNILCPKGELTVQFTVGNEATDYSRGTASGSVRVVHFSDIGREGKPSFRVYSSRMPAKRRYEVKAPPAQWPLWGEYIVLASITPSESEAGP